MIGQYRWFWNGIKHDISLCCIMFFETAWSDCIKKEICEYADNPLHHIDNQGIVFCPDCIAKKLLV